jgi:hypothetical protein
VAIEAPLHLQGVLRIHERHLINPPMARCAADAFVYVNGMIEIDEVRKVVNPNPGNRLAASPAITDWLEQLRIGPDLRVAIDTGLRGRNTGVARFLNRCMTVLALEAQTLDVVLVAERHRLLGTLTLPRHPGGTLQLIERNSQGNHDQPRQYETHASQRIGAAVKDLRHEFFLLGTTRVCMRPLCRRSHMLCTNINFGCNTSKNEGKLEKLIYQPDAASQTFPTQISEKILCKIKLATS